MYTLNIICLLFHQEKNNPSTAEQNRKILKVEINIHYACKKALTLRVLQSSLIDVKDM